MATEGERIATVEQILRDIRDDLRDWTVEQRRTRERVHVLEATVKGLVMMGDDSAKETQRRQAKIQGRLRLLTVVIAAAALLEPFIYHYSRF